MKIFSNFIEIERWDKSLKELSHIDFSLFYDYIPQNINQFSKYNIFIACEPNEYFGHHDWIIQNNYMFDFILTWSEFILEKCNNALFLAYGESWFQDNPLNSVDIEKKEFKTSFLRGNKLKLKGHYIRHELYNRRNEIKNPIIFWDSLGDPNNWENWRDSKINTFKPYQFSICIENSINKNYFTEKITDCFLQKTIPIYWGCPNIGDFYDINGILLVDNVDSIIKTINSLKNEDFKHYTPIIERNYKIALDYKDYVFNVKEKIKEIFKLNELL